MILAAGKHGALVLAHGQCCTVRVHSPANKLSTRIHPVAGAVYFQSGIMTGQRRPQAAKRLRGKTWGRVDADEMDEGGAESSCTGGSPEYDPTTSSTSSPMPYRQAFCFVMLLIFGTVMVLQPAEAHAVGTSARASQVDLALGMPIWLTLRPLSPSPPTPTTLPTPTVPPLSPPPRAKVQSPPPPPYLILPTTELAVLTSSLPSPPPLAHADLPPEPAPVVSVSQVPVVSATPLHPSSVGLLSSPPAVNLLSSPPEVNLPSPPPPVKLPSLPPPVVAGQPSPPCPLPSPPLRPPLVHTLCCPAGHACREMSALYSQCRPAAEVEEGVYDATGCIPSGLNPYAQCAGLGITVTQESVEHPDG